MSETQNKSGADKKPSWERDVLEKLALEQFKEQRISRRWNVGFKLFFAIYLVVLFVVAMGDGVGSISGKHTALVDIEGVIGPGMDVDADRIVAGLRAAFEEEQAVAVILRINSPGGSPVQAGYINDEIIRLRKKYPDRPVYAVISDICASGGYYIAVAAETIYANKASIVGSIGVLMDGFGFVDTMKKVGVERRLLTAGENKGFLDPFSPLTPDDKEHAQRLLEEVHKQFIKAVQNGRGEKLVHDQDLFSGLFWTGEQAMKLGLVDALGSASYVAREIIGAEKIVDYTPKQDFVERITKRFGAAMARAFQTDAFKQRIMVALPMGGAGR
ncbi:MAG TPA: S49 family peptidase [Acidiferrobacteraceae bacterium]|mgnify:CR=1 FL=1|nr:S49 family peptidase [Acidiferrobacteraceae bacterium]